MSSLVTIRSMVTTLGPLNNIARHTSQKGLEDQKVCKPERTYTTKNFATQNTDLEDQIVGQSKRTYQKVCKATTDLQNQEVRKPEHVLGRPKSSRVKTDLSKSLQAKMDLQDKNVRKPERTYTIKKFATQNTDLEDQIVGQSKRITE